MKRLQSLDISEVLRAPSGSYIGYEVLERDDLLRFVSLLKIDAAHSCQDVDAAGTVANLEYDPFRGEIRYLEHRTNAHLNAPALA